MSTLESSVLPTITELPTAEDRLETVLATEFQTRQARTVLALVTGEAIIPQETPPGYNIDTKKAADILGKLPKTNCSRRYTT